MIQRFQSDLFIPDPWRSPTTIYKCHLTIPKRSRLESPGPQRNTRNSLIPTFPSFALGSPPLLLDAQLRGTPEVATMSHHCLRWWGFCWGFFVGFVCLLFICLSFMCVGREGNLIFGCFINLIRVGFQVLPLKHLKHLKLKPLKTGRLPQKERRTSSNHPFSRGKLLVSGRGKYSVA